MPGAFTALFPICQIIVAPEKIKIETRENISYRVYKQVPDQDKNWWKMPIVKNSNAIFRVIFR